MIYAIVSLLALCALFLGCIAFYLHDEYRIRKAESFRMKKRK